MSGNSSWHGGQSVPMKLTQTGLPLRFARSIVPPPTWGTTSGGAGSPMWNRAGRPDAPGTLGRRRRDARRRRRRRGRRGRASDGASDDGTGRRRRRPAPGSGRRQDPPEHQPRDGHPGHEAGDDRQTCPHGARRVPVRAARGASGGPAATIPLRCPAVRARPHAPRSPPSSPPLGVTLLAAGLLTYTTPVAAEPGAGRRPTASADRRADRRRRRCITLPPLGSAGRRPAPTPTPTRPGRDARPHRRARHRPAGRQAGPADGYPLCDVAMCDRRASAARPGPGHYLYAHARDGMFLPLLDVEDQERQEAARHGRRGLDQRRPALPLRDHRGPAPPADARRRARRRPSEELWLQTSEGPQGHVGQDPGHRQAALRRSRPTTRRRPPEGEAGRPAASAVAGPIGASDPVDPAQHDRRDRRDPDDERGDRPEPAGLAAAERVPASLIPKIPATAPIPARMTVTPVSRFMITDRLLLIVGQVHVERRRRQLAVVVELVGQPDDVVVDVAEVDELVLVDRAACPGSSAG